VLIAKGTYYPTGVQNGTQRDSTFGIFRTGIMLFGGYPNGGGVRFSGDGATILSANIGNIQDSTDNSYHVVVVTGVNSDIGAIRLDGLTIKDAFVNRFDRDIVYYNGVVDTVSSRRGGGIAIQNNHANFNIEIYNCKVTNNLMNMGAGLY